MFCCHSVIDAYARSDIVRDARADETDVREKPGSARRRSGTRHHHPRRWKEVGFSPTRDARRLAPRTLGPMSDALERLAFIARMFDFPISLV
jgi:hypothetical protein